MKQSSLIFVFILLIQYSDFTYAANLTVFCGNTSNNESYPLTKPLPLLDSKCFNDSLSTMIYAFGFTSSASDNCTQVILDSYLSCGNYNVILLDWAKEVASITDPLRFLSYPRAIINSIKIGKECADALNMMSNSALNNTLNLNNTHLIGHSLGAQMVGYCGHQLQTYNKNVSRITGMDPARPGFSGWSSIFLGAFKEKFLTPSSGKFVDALHTDKRFYGTTKVSGQVDIWFNCNKTDQPQCTKGTNKELASCDHYAACYYYAIAVSESKCVKKETSFLAVSCPSCEQFSTQTATVGINATIYVGETMDTSTRGNFYISTNATYPYGAGEGGI